MTFSEWTVPSTWSWTKMGTIAEVVGGGTPRTSDSANFKAGTIPWVTPADLSGYTSKMIVAGQRNITERGLSSSSARLLPEASVLLTTRAPIGYVVVAANPVSTNQGFKSFVLHGGVFSSYVYHWLKAAKPILDEMGTGTTFKEISGSRAAEIPVPLAPLAEQHRIVDEIEKQLTRLDAAVAALERARGNLKRYRASVLKAAVEGRLVTVEGEWSSARLGDVTTRSEYGTSTKCDYAGSGMPVLRIPNIAKGRIDLDDLKFSREKLQVKPGDELQEGDLLIIRTNGSVSLIGKTAVVGQSPPEPQYFASYLLRFRFSNAVSPRWVHMYLASPEGRQFIESNAASSAGQHNINLKLMHSMTLPLPSLREQEQIVAEVERRSSVVESLESTVDHGLKRAERLRQSVLKRAFEGRLVPQDPDDEPASVLLERIRAERANTQASPRRGRKTGRQLELREATT